MVKALIVIGRQDKVDLPGFELYGIDAKVDTGAYTSAINCSRVKVKVVGGIETLLFQISGSRIGQKKARRFSTVNFEKRKIRSSNGVSEERFIIETDITIFGKKRKVEFSLADRSKMKFPILLGRRFLSGRFLVDVQKKNLSYNQKIKS